MFKNLAFTTAITILGAQADTTPPEISAAELVYEDHWSEQGVEIDHYVTRDANAGLLSEASLRDPSRHTTEIDVWTDGVTLWWDGLVDDQRVCGEAPIGVLADYQEAAFCFTPLTAIVCVGALVVVAGASSCGLFRRACPVPDPKVPGGAGGDPPPPGGGGDGDDEGESGTGDSGGDGD